ncbi:hypothetical protein NW754_011700 [Fusarium falciforme]|nr:hypothetical protein NW754_011700 [Fusarium falciforme]
MKEFPRKFLSLRDKNGSGRRSKSAAPAPPVPATSDNANKNKPRPLSAGAFMSMFKTDNAKPGAKADAEKEKDTARVEEILRRLDELNITNVTADHINDIMATKFANHDPEKDGRIHRHGAEGGSWHHHPLRPKRGNGWCRESRQRNVLLGRPALLHVCQA